MVSLFTLSFNRILINLFSSYSPVNTMQYTRGHRGGVIPIAEYGVEFIKGGKNVKPRKPVRLLYSGKNHYDLLL